MESHLDMLYGDERVERETWEQEASWLRGPEPPNSLTWEERQEFERRQKSEVAG